MSKASATAKQLLPDHATANLFENNVENIVRFVSSAVDSVDRLVEDSNSVATSSRTGTDVYGAASDSFDINQSFIPPQLFLEPFPPPSFTDSFKAIQKWEGYVIEVYEETFLARLIPILGEGADQEAEIYIEEVEPVDQVLIEPGAVFYWSIGYLDKPSGRHRDSYIRFRRLPAWTRRELKAAREKAKMLQELLNVK